MANTGWTWDEALDTLTTPRFLALQAEWRRRPPAHWLLAALLRYQAPGATPEQLARQPSLAELKAALSDSAAHNALAKL